MITVSLPFPDPRLNPNRSSGRHWGGTSALRKKARSDAHILTVAAMGKRERFDSGEVALDITFVQPDRRKRDRDNLLAASKPFLDGVADALGINDAQFEPVTIRREYGVKPGAVVVRLSRKVAA